MHKKSDADKKRKRERAIVAWLLPGLG